MNKMHQDARGFHHVIPASGFTVADIQKTTAPQGQSYTESLMKTERKGVISKLKSTFSSIGRILHRSDLGQLVDETLTVLKNPGAHFMSRRQLKKSLHESGQSLVHTTAPQEVPHIQLSSSKRKPSIK